LPRAAAVDEPPHVRHEGVTHTWRFRRYSHKRGLGAEGPGGIRFTRARLWVL